MDCPLCATCWNIRLTCSPGGGWGPWSDNSAMIQTTAPEIEIPKPPDVVSSTTTTIFLQWEVPKQWYGQWNYLQDYEVEKLGKNLVVLYMGERILLMLGAHGRSLCEHQYFKTFMWKTNSFRGSRRTGSHSTLLD